MNVEVVGCCESRRLQVQTSSSPSSSSPLPLPSLSSWTSSSSWKLPWGISEIVQLRFVMIGFKGHSMNGFNRQTWVRFPQHNKSILKSYFTKVGRSRPLFLNFFLFFLNVQFVDGNLPLLGFKPRISGVGSDRSTNCPSLKSYYCVLSSGTKVVAQLMTLWWVLCMIQGHSLSLRSGIWVSGCNTAKESRLCDQEGVFKSRHGDVPFSPLLPSSSFSGVSLNRFFEEVQHEQVLSLAA